MPIRRRHLPLALLVALILPAGAAAHVGDALYFAIELPDSLLPDLHDGTLADWAGLPAPSMTERDFGSLEVGDGAAIGPPDLAANIWLAWNAHTGLLYAAVERLDDVYINTYEGGDPVSYWQYDSIEFMVDGDHSGGAYNGFIDDDCGYKRAGAAQEIDMCLYRDQLQAQQYYAIAASPDGRLLFRQGRASPWVTAPPYGDAGGFLEPGVPHRSVIELAVTPFDTLLFDNPERSVPSLLEAGRIIGVSVTLPDFDTEPRHYHGFSTLAGQPNTWRLADNFVDVLLVGGDGLPTDGDVDSTAFVVVDGDGDGRLDAGERGRILVARVVPAGTSLRIDSDDPHFEPILASATLDDRLAASLSFPTFTVRPDAVGEGELSVHLEVTGAGTKVANYTMRIATRSPRLDIDSLQIVDASPLGLGDGDGRPKVGETVRLHLVLSRPCDLGRTRVRLRGLSAGLDTTRQNLSVLPGNPARPILSGPTWLVGVGAEGLDTLRFELTSVGPYATWVETLAVGVAAGSDRVAPAIGAAPRFTSGPAGLFLYLAARDVIDGSPIAGVEVEILDDGGPLMGRVPMVRVADHYEGLWPQRSGPRYVRLVVAATDIAGNAATDTTRQWLSASPDSGAVIDVLSHIGRTRGSVGEDLVIGEPAALAVDAAGALWVADRDGDRILRRQRTGLAQTLTATPEPLGLAVDAGGVAYVANAATVRRRAADGSWTGLGDGLQLDGPAGLALGPAGRLYVTDTGHDRVVRFPAGGGPPAVVAGDNGPGFSGDGGPGTRARLASPRGLALDPAGGLYIADTGNQVVRYLSPQGTIATVVGVPPAATDPAADPEATRLDAPVGVALDADGALFIGDSGNRRVLRLDADGAVTTLWTSPGRPATVAVGPDGDLFVGDVGVRSVVRLDGVAGPPPEPPPTAVAVGASLPEGPALGPSYPNPFNAATLIPVTVATGGPVRLEIFDVLGRRTRLLWRARVGAGTYRLRWDGADDEGRAAASGLYLARLRTPAGQWTRRMILLR